MFNRCSHAFLLAVSLLLCSCMDGPRTIAEQANLNITVEELTSRIRNEVKPISSIIEDAAEHILTIEQDPLLRMRVKRWRIDAITIFQGTLLHEDPLIAWGDAWVYSMQVLAYLDQQNEEEAWFGPHQTTVRDHIQLIFERLYQLGVLVSSEENIDTLYGKMNGWAEKHPLHRPWYGRESINSEIVKNFARTDYSAFSSVGVIENNFTTLNDRVAVYSAYIPERIRWEADAFIDEQLERDEVQGLLAQLTNIATQAENLEQLNPQLSALDKRLETSFTQLDKQIDDVRTFLRADIDEFLATTLTQVAVLQEQVINITKGIQKLDKRLESLETRIGDELSKIHARTIELENNAPEIIDASVAKVEHRVLSNAVLLEQKIINYALIAGAALILTILAAAAMIAWALKKR